MRTREVLKHVTIMLEALEDNTKLTEEVKSTYGYNSGWWGSDRVYYDRWKVKNVIPYSGGNGKVTKTALKKVKSFLEEATKYGFIGDVRLEQGYGMWATTRTGTVEEKKGEISLYHTFSSDSNFYKVIEGRITSEQLTTKELKKYIEEKKL